MKHSSLLYNVFKKYIVLIVLLALCIPSSISAQTLASNNVAEKATDMLAAAGNPSASPVVYAKDKDGRDVYTSPLTGLKIKVGDKIVLGVPLRADNKFNNVRYVPHNYHESKFADTQHLTAEYAGTMYEIVGISYEPRDSNMGPNVGYARFQIPGKKEMYGEIMIELALAQKELIVK